MSDVIDLPADFEPDPIEIDPRPCEHCGLLLDDHFTIDGPEGPEHFCHPLDVALQLRALRLQEAWERADARDSWNHTGDPAPPASVRNSDISAKPANAPRPYHTPQSTINAFLYVARNHDAAYVAKWLANHPQDVAFLTKLWEGKNGN
jgi:hypothetical protein